MRKKKILHLITGLEIGGAEMMLLKTLPRLQDDFDNRVCCIRGHGPIAAQLEATGVPVTFLNLKHPLDIGAIFRFRKIILEFQPDILVTYLIHADLFGRIFGRLFGVRKVVCSVRVKLIQVKYLPLLLLDAISSPLVTHYHFNSEAVANMYRRYFFLSEKKITIIPNGLELDKYQISIDTKKKRQELNLPENAILIGCIGRLEKQKGQKYLIEAFSKIARRYPSSHLIIVGDGSDKDSLQRLSYKTGISESVIFLGKRSDVPEILGILDIFVLPSLYEGMSNALMEAMASGCSIIATDIPENKELIENKINGLLVRPKNCHALTISIEQLILVKKESAILARNAQRTALQKFNLVTIVNQYCNLFSK